jgi:hypothetical protein
MQGKRFSFSIVANSLSRELFFVLEKSGDLRLVFRHSLLSNENNKNDPAAGKIISNQRYSIHKSLDRVHNVNTIKHTYIIGEHVRYGFNYTKVIKSKTGFVPLFLAEVPIWRSSITLPH